MKLDPAEVKATAQKHTAVPMAKGGKERYSEPVQGKGTWES